MRKRKRERIEKGSRERTALDTKRPVDLLGICHLLSIQQVYHFFSFMGALSVIYKYLQHCILTTESILVYMLVL